MNKKLIYIIIAVIVALCVGVGLILINGNKQNTETSNNNSQSNSNTEVNENTNNDNTNTSIEGNKILVVYYSAQNHTERVAKEVAKNLNAEAIIAYRDSHGLFNSVDEIMNVSGIKEGVYNNIKDYITLN